MRVRYTGRIRVGRSIGYCCSFGMSCPLTDCSSNRGRRTNRIGFGDSNRVRPTASAGMTRGVRLAF